MCNVQPTIYNLELCPAGNVNRARWLFLCVACCFGYGCRGMGNESYAQTTVQWNIYQQFLTSFIVDCWMCSKNPKSCAVPRGICGKCWWLGFMEDSFASEDGTPTTDLVHISILQLAEREFSRITQLIADAHTFFSHRKWIAISRLLKPFKSSYGIHQCMVLLSTEKSKLRLREN